MLFSDLLQIVSVEDSSAWDVSVALFNQPRQVGGDVAIDARVTATIGKTKLTYLSPFLQELMVSRAGCDGE